MLLWNRENLSPRCTGAWANRWLHCRQDTEVIQEPEGVIWYWLMTAVPSCYTGQLLGTSTGLSVWCCWTVFGTLHHTAALRRTSREVGQAKVRTKLTGSTADALKQMHILDVHKQMDRHTPSSQPAPHQAISGKNTALGHTLPPALPLSLPRSLLPHGLPRHCSSPLYFLCQHVVFNWFSIYIVLRTFQPFLSPLCDYFTPHTLGCVTLESRLSEKVTVS